MILVVEFVVDSDSGRIDAYLASRVGDLSRSRIQELIRDQHILVDGRPVKPRDPVRPEDLSATMFHLLGINHDKLTYRYGGRDHRLTDVHGSVVRAILS